MGILADRVAISTEKGLEYVVRRLWDIARQPSLMGSVVPKCCPVIRSGVGC